MYHHARVTDGIGVECATSFSEDYKVFNITNCVKDVSSCMLASQMCNCHYANTPMRFKILLKSKLC